MAPIYIGPKAHTDVVQFLCVNGEGGGREGGIGNADLV